MNAPMGDPTPNDYQHAKAEAKAAKAYAKATRPWYKKKRWGVAAVAAILIGQAAASGSEEEPAAAASKPAASADKSTDAETPKKEKPAKEAPAEEAEEPAAEGVRVVAAQIVKEFEENELAADSKYKDKDLEITGKVIKIDTEFLDDDKYYVALGKGKWDFLTVNCHEMPTDELATLSVGQTVTVFGAFDDGGDLGVEVNDCKLA